MEGDPGSPKCSKGPHWPYLCQTPVTDDDGGVEATQESSLCWAPVIATGSAFYSLGPIHPNNACLLQARHQCLTSNGKDTTDNKKHSSNPLSSTSLVMAMAVLLRNILEGN